MSPARQTTAKTSGSRLLYRKETISAYLFMLPALIFFGGFIILPMITGLFTSFFDYTLSDFTFVGLKNYIRLFQDSTFWKSMWNTIVLVVGSVPLVTIISLWVGSVIYQKNPVFRSIFRGIFYLPVVTGTVAVVVVWKWMFDPYTGLLNWALKGIGLIDQNIMWLGDSRFAIWCILLILITTSVGQPIVLYVAALGNVDQSLVEAAEVDGATQFQTFWKIKWPSIRPTTLYVVVITTINSFQCFSLIQLLTRGGPNFGTSTAMYYLYQNAFDFKQFGYANAIGVVLAVVIGLFSSLQFKSLGGDDS